MSGQQRYRDAAGLEVLLGSELGRGGEGSVFSVVGNNAVAAKIYHSPLASERRDKILAMVGANWYKGAANVAFPISGLFDKSGHFVGFTMAKVGGRKPIHTVYSPTSRKTEYPQANFPFLVNVALNVARAVAKVNSLGCVVGDINHSGILVAEDSTATLIDCDSFQFAQGGKLFRCKVGVPEFTPPELQGKRLDQITRTPEHDSFGIAVLIFNLLFMGRHPFAGKFLGRGDMPMGKAIAEFRFAYSSRVRETQMSPPPNVPLLSDIPGELADALEIAFGPVGVSRGRPTLAKWVELLERSRASIVSCNVSSSHHYFGAAKVCPWCRMERAYPGFLAFPIPIPAFPQNTSLDIGQLIAAINGVRDPGPAKDLEATLPSYNGSPNTIRISAGRWKRRYFAGLAVAAASLECFYLPAPGPIVAAIGVGVGVWLSFKQWDAVEPYRKKTQQIKATFENLRNQWSAVSDSRQFQEVRNEAQLGIRQFQNLVPDEVAKLAELKSQLRQRQLERFLERFHIAHADIKGIGTARTLTLQSWQVETAADISRQRVMKIPGFGPAITTALLEWRRAIERQFRFNPNEPVNPADIAAVRVHFANRRNDLERELRNLLSKLQGKSVQIVQARQQIQSAALPVWNALKQAELDEHTVRSQLPSTVHKWVFGGSLLAILVVLVNLNTPQKFSDVPSPSGSKSIPSRYDDKPPSAPLPQPNHAGVTPSFPPAPIPDPAPAITVQTPNRPASSQAPLGPIIAENTSVQPETVPQSTAGLPAPVPSQDEMPPASPPLRNLRNRSDVDWVQQQLSRLGYLRRTTPGVWDGNSRQALIDFKIANSLSKTDSLDVQAQQVLGSDSAIKFDDTFLGAWTETPGCPSHEPDIVMSVRRASSSGGGVCDFLDVAGENGGWRVHARCTVQGNSWTREIRFKVAQGQLFWIGNSSTTYFRCK
jgi:DNA-binding helix-hairpin-helix protein with protein kinase domain